MRLHIPIKLPSIANTRVHWRKMARLKIKQREATAYCMVGKVIPPLPLVVTITRIGPRRLDDDNLASACKYIRDQIADVVGTDDGSPLYTWQYRQRARISPPGAMYQYAVEVEIVQRKEMTDGNESEPR